MATKNFSREIARDRKLEEINLDDTFVGCAMTKWPELFGMENMKGYCELK